MALKKDRLDKVLASQGSMSRKDVRELVDMGLITVNGKVCLRCDTKIDINSDTVALRGEVLDIRKFIYIMLNKPMGVVSATRDDARKTVVDLVPKDMQRTGLFPAGRLDKDTTGMVIITDDGQFAHRILAPKSHVPKTYLVTLDKPLTSDLADKFGQGMVIDGQEQCMPSRLQIVEERQARVVIWQGMYHQIKRMFYACGYQVTALHREKMGGLELDPSLGPGECRILTEEEKALLEDRNSEGFFGKSDKNRKGNI